MVYRIISDHNSALTPALEYVEERVTRLMSSGYETVGGINIVKVDSFWIVSQAVMNRTEKPSWLKE